MKIWKDKVRIERLRNLITANPTEKRSYKSPLKKKVGIERLTNLISDKPIQKITYRLLKSLGAKAEIYGSIRIESKPSVAMIFFDGNAIGTTPDSIKDVDPGIHEMKLRVEGYEVWSTTVDVKAGKENVVTAILKKKTNSISINSDPANARIFLDNKDVGETPKTITDLKPGNYTVEVKMDGYEGWSEIVDVVADKEKVLTATLQMKVGSINIKSDPAEARIFLDNKDVGTTPETITDLKPGNYTVEIKIDGYEVWSRNVNVESGEENTLTAVLQESTGSIGINSNPAKARIFLDNKDVGATPKTITDLKPGNYTVEVKMDGYEVWSEIVDVVAGKEKVLTAALQMKFGSFSVNSDPVKARIFLDNKDVGTTPKTITDLKPGNYTVEVKMDGYEVWSEIVDVVADKEKVLTAVLQMKAGSFIVISNPMKARIYLDGKDIGITPATITDLKPGYYTVKINKEGYKAWEEVVPVGPGDESLISARLENEEIRLRSKYGKLPVSHVHSLPYLSIRETQNHILNCHCTLNHNYEEIILNEDTVIIDHTTKLMWHQSGSSEYMNLGKAKKWLKDLNTNSYAGYSDWRLPTVEEAASLLEANAERSNYFIDPVFAKNQWGIWTGDRINRNLTWVVIFVNGTINQSHVRSASTFVRPVRSLK